MKTLIDVSKYAHVKSIYWGGWLESSYNHNYYFSSQLKHVILEICDDDNFFQYYKINGYSIQHIGNYFGIGGIFEDENTIVELDTDLSNN